MIDEEVYLYLDIWEMEREQRFPGSLGGDSAATSASSMEQKLS